MKRTVLITGGARGIGAAIAAKFQQEEYNVITPSRAELDLADPQSLENYITRITTMPIDILINNAGINILNPITAIDATTWQTMLQVNLTSPLRLAQALLPGMKERGWGRVLSISSIFSLVTKEKRAAYSMTKSGLNAFARSVTVEYGRHGILANTLCPGYVDSALTRQNNSAQEIEGDRRHDSRPPLGASRGNRARRLLPCLRRKLLHRRPGNRRRRRISLSIKPSQ